MAAHTDKELKDMLERAADNGPIIAYEDIGIAVSTDSSGSPTCVEIHTTGIVDSRSVDAMRELQIAGQLPASANGFMRRLGSKGGAVHLGHAREVMAVIRGLTLFVQEHVRCCMFPGEIPTEPEQRLLAHYANHIRANKLSLPPDGKRAELEHVTDTGTALDVGHTLREYLQKKRAQWRKKCCCVHTGGGVRSKCEPCVEAAEISALLTEIGSR